MHIVGGIHVQCMWFQGYYHAERVACCRYYWSMFKKKTILTANIGMGPFKSNIGKFECPPKAQK